MDKTALKKGLFAFILAAVVALLLAGCSGGASEKKAEEPKEVTYESILEDYTAQLKEQAPVLVDEYKAEAKEKAGNKAQFKFYNYTVGAEFYKSWVLGVSINVSSHGARHSLPACRSYHNK